MRKSNKHAHSKSSRDSSPLRSIRLSDGTFAGRIAGKHVWSVGGTAQRGTMVHRMAPKARRSAAALPIHVNLHVRHLQPVLQLQIRQLQRLHTVEQHIRRIDRDVTRVVERIVPSPSLPVASAQSAATVKETVREIVRVVEQRMQHSQTERSVNGAARHNPMPDKEGEQRQRIEVRWNERNAANGQRFRDDADHRLSVVYRPLHTNNRHDVNIEHHTNTMHRTSNTQHTNYMNNTNNTSNARNTNNASNRVFVNDRNVWNTIRNALRSLSSTERRHYRIDRHYESTINHVHNRNSAVIPSNRDKNDTDYPIMPMSSLRTSPQQAAAHTVRLMHETRLLLQYAGVRQRNEAPPAGGLETAGQTIGGQGGAGSANPSIVLLTSNRLIIPWQSGQASSRGMRGIAESPLPANHARGAAALTRRFTTLQPVLQQHRHKGSDKRQAQETMQPQSQSQLVRIERAKQNLGTSPANIHYYVTIPARTGHTGASAGAMLRAAQTVLTESRSMTAHIYQAHTRLTEIQRINNSNSNSNSNSAQSPVGQTPHTQHVMGRTNRIEQQTQLVTEQANRIEQQTHRVTEQTNRSVRQTQQVTEQANRIVLQTLQVTEQTNRIEQQTRQLTEQTNRTVQQTQHVTEQTNRTVQQTQHVTEQTNRTVQQTQHVFRHRQLTIQSHRDMQQISHTVRVMNLITQQNKHLILRSTLARGKRGMIEPADAGAALTKPGNLPQVQAQAAGRQGAIRATRTSMLQPPTMANPAARLAHTQESASGRTANARLQTEQLRAPQHHVHRPTQPAAAADRVQLEQHAVRNTVHVANRRLMAQVVQETTARTVRQVRREIVRQEHATVHAVQRTIQAEVQRTAAPIGSSSLRPIRVSHRSMPLTPARSGPVRASRTSSIIGSQAASAMNAPLQPGAGQEASAAAPLIMARQRSGKAARAAESAVSRETKQPQAIRLDVAARRTASPVVNETVIESLQQTIKTVEQELNQAKAQWKQPSIDMNRLADQMFKEFSQRLRHAQQRRGM